MGCYQSKKKISLSVERMLCIKLVSLLNVNLISCLFLSTGCKEKQVSEAEIFDASWNGEPTCKGTAITFYSLLIEFTEKKNIDVYGLPSPKRCRKWISSVIIQDLRYDANDSLHCFRRTIQSFGFCSQFVLKWGQGMPVYWMQCGLVLFLTRTKV